MILNVLIKEDLSEVTPSELRFKMKSFVLKWEGAEGETFQNLSSRYKGPRAGQNSECWRASREVSGTGDEGVYMAEHAGSGDKVSPNIL
jgi:hypothetical protein